MAFRFRKSSRLGPLRFHVSKNGLSSISVGGRSASFNVPVNRSGGNRSTVGLPGTAAALAPLQNAQLGTLQLQAQQWISDKMHCQDLCSWTPPSSTQPAVSTSPKTGSDR